MARLKAYLPEFVYGGIDGAVTTFAVAAGAVGASLPPPIILILGFANLFADGFSMAVSNYLSCSSRLDLSAPSRVVDAGKRPIETACATFISFIVVGFIPLVPFVVAHFVPVFTRLQFTLSSIATALAFLIVGNIKGKVTGRGRAHSALITLTVGGIAAIIAYAVGEYLSGLVDFTV